MHRLKTPYLQGFWSGPPSNRQVAIQVLVIITIRAGSSPVSRTKALKTSSFQGFSFVLGRGCSGLEAV